ncbi:MAG: hypothetical protein Q7U16_16795 [Agitococcus sp.]|nr:hypothetical protein [Agitococcus sp.]
MQEAASFYLETLKSGLPLGTDVSQLQVSFTGHSLGGGLASLMSVYFNKPAVVFDEAPFKKSADSSIVVNNLRSSLLAQGYVIPDELRDYVTGDITGAVEASPTRVEREHLVTQCSIKGEVLSLAGDATINSIAVVLGALGLVTLSPTVLFASLAALNVAKIKGFEVPAFDLHEHGINPVELHSIVLLSGILQSPAFLSSLQANPELFDKLMINGVHSKIDPSTKEHVLLDLLVERQTLGEGALDLLAIDVNKLSTTGLVGQLDSHSTRPLAAVLMNAALASLYQQANERTLGVTDLTPLRTILENHTGAITVDTQTLGANTETILNEFATEIQKALPTGITITDLSAFPRLTFQNGPGAMDVAFIQDTTNDVMVGGTGND